MSKLSLAILIIMVSAGAAAQDCVIAAYADSEGASSSLLPTDGASFSIYVVLFAEDTVGAVAYRLNYPSDIYLQARIAGPSGNGLIIDESTGTNVALGECALGFGAQPVLIDEYQFVTFFSFGGEDITLGPNPSQDPDYPQYVTCNDLTKDCEPGPTLDLDCILPECATPTDASGFSTIKSLFHKH